MLIEPNSNLYSYSITRDFGFAPNPFYGFCTLATCKPDIRKAAKLGDWVMGVGGVKLKTANRKCIFLMKVTEKIGFQDYWNDERFSLKKPCRNGSRVQMLGDNIYHRDKNNMWIQEDSHHSNSDGSPNLKNLDRDTGRCDKVLISDFFLYFGKEAINIDLNSIGYSRIRNMKKTDLSKSQKGKKLIESVWYENLNNRNLIIANPCQFMESDKRVDQVSGKLV